MAGFLFAFFFSDYVYLLHFFFWPPLMFFKYMLHTTVRYAKVLPSSSLEITFMHKILFMPVKLI